MSKDAQDIGVARYVKTTGMATPEQLAGALQAQARKAQSGTPVSLADALVELGVITPAQRETVERKVQTQQTGATTLGTYRLLKKLGEGGMGAVYLAEDTTLARKVAVKVLPRRLAGDGEFLTRFRREAESAARLRHPNIVGAFTVGEELGYHFYVMEYAEGEPLDRTLKRGGALPVARAVEIALQVARGLQHSHAQGIIHRDIKPANIVVAPDRTAKILDLGLSKNLGDSGSSFRTVSGAVLGTPHYISPEQAEGKREVDGRSDIYSLGATLYHLVTGHTPYEGATAVEILYKHVHEQLANPQDLREEIPDGVVHVIRRMMAKDPADRYPDGAGLIADLEEVKAGRKPQSGVLEAQRSSVALLRRRIAHRPAPPPRPVRRGSGVWIWFGLMATAVFALVLAALFSGRRPTDRAPAAVAPPAPPAPRPPAPPEDPWKGAVDLLRLVDPARDAVHGIWKLEGGKLVSDASQFARIEIPYRPPEEYDFRVVFSRKNGKCETNQVLSRSGRPFLWAMGTDGNRKAGLSRVAGAAATGNSTTVAAALEDGVTHTSVVQVRRNRVAAILNGKTLVDWKTDFKELDIEVGWALRDPSILGMGSCDTATTFHSAALLEVTGRGAPVERPKSRPADDAWITGVQALPPQRQVEEVDRKLRELNPGYAGRMRANTDEGRVTMVLLEDESIADVSPLRALRHLAILGLDRTRVEDLRPLRDLPLRELYLGGTLVRDLTPLRALSLQSLTVNSTRVATLAGLERSPLVHLGCQRTSVSDLSLLRGKRITRIHLAGSPIGDFSPLEGMPLKEISIDVSERSLAFLRKFPALDRINDLPAVEFWREPAAADARPWKAVFDGRSMDGLNREIGGWNLEGGALSKIVPAAESAVVRTAGEFADGQIRLRFEAQGANYVEFIVRQGPGGNDMLEFDRPQLAAMEGKPHEVVFTCRGPEITATLDGQPAKLSRRSPARRGFVQVSMTGEAFRLLSIDFRELP